MAFPTPEELEVVLQPVVDRHGLVIEGIKAVPAGKKSQVRVLVDATSSPDLDKLEAVSDDISQALDAAEEAGTVAMGAGYNLEVSTPGVDHPLTASRHWLKNKDRLVEVERVGHGPVRARIGSMDAEHTRVILISTAKNPQVGVLEVAQVQRAVVQIEFAKIPPAQQELADLDFDTAAKQATDWLEENK